MAHFAQMFGNEVQSVIVVSNDDCDNLPFPESEPVGQAYIASLGIEGTYLQTSYNGSFRGIYAFPSAIFDPVKNEFTYPVVEP